MGLFFQKWPFGQKERQMCSMEHEGRTISFRDFFTNWQQPMPLHEKVSKTARNLWRRGVLRQPCCGHDGEPGC